MSGLRPITNTEDRIDTREIHSRIRYLTCDNVDDDGNVLPERDWNDAGEYEEYVSLRDLLTEVESVLSNGESTKDGVTLVRETNWVDYVTEWYADTWHEEWFERDERTYRERRLTWDDITSRAPFNAIDWAQVARGDKTNHSQVTFGGVDWVVVG